MENYYELLGVPEDAPTEEIKKAYRKAVKKYHPDLHPGATPAEKKELEAKTKLLNEAYTTLSDYKKRAEYTVEYKAWRNYGSDPRGSRSGYSGTGYGTGGTDGSSGQSSSYYGYRGYGNRSYGDNYGSEQGWNNSVSREEWEELQRQWQEFSRRNGSSGERTYGQPEDDPFSSWTWGSTEDNPFFRSGSYGRNSSWSAFDIFTGGKYRRRSPFGIFTTHFPTGLVLLGVLFFLLFGRYILFFLLIYFIIKLVIWAVRIIAR